MTNENVDAVNMNSGAAGERERLTTRGIVHGNANSGKYSFVMTWLPRFSAAIRRRISPFPSASRRQDKQGNVSGKRIELPLTSDDVR